MDRNLKQVLKESLKEVAFRLYCDHEQGNNPNVFVYCSRRGGSTWLLSILAAHPGVRYVGRPFLTLLWSRWRWTMPDLNLAAGTPASDHPYEHFVGFGKESEAAFLKVARSLADGSLVINPVLRLNEPYFQRNTDRIVYQVTNATALAEMLTEQVNACPVVLVRHPIPTALSIMAKGWRVEAADFLSHRAFVTSALDDQQRELANRIMNQGDEFEKHVLDWSLKMMQPIRLAMRRPDVPRLSYEHLVLDPSETVVDLARALDLAEVEPMLEQAKRPSVTVTEATATQVDNSDYLLSRWRKKISPQRERSLLEITKKFGVGIYEPGQDGPTHESFQSAAANR